MPLSVKIVPGNSSKEETEKQEAERSEKANIDKKVAFETQRIADYTWWLAGFSLAVALVAIGQAGLFIWQLRYMRQGMNDATIAANAAALGARAAVAIELPIIRVAPEKASYGEGIEFGVRTEYLYLQRMLYTNGGRTKAFPIAIEFGWTVGDDLPAEPVYKHTKTFGIDYTLRPDVPDFDDMDVAMDLPNSCYDQIRSGATKMWLYCRFTYLDFMQTKRDAGFCWLRHEGLGGGRFLIDATPAYNRKT